MSHVRRREFIGVLGGAALWPLAVRAQQAGKLPTIGFLGTASASAWGPWTAAFVQRLRALDWIEGRTVAIEYRWAEGRTERYAEIAAEFVRLKVDIIVTSGGAVLAARQATSVIPIVFAVANDPLGSGLVASLSRPGGNVTGLSAQQADLVSKRLELLREVAPVFASWVSWPMLAIPPQCLKWTRCRARPAPSALKSPNSKSGDPRISLPPSRRSRVARKALYVCSDPFVNANRIRINTLALVARLPTSYAHREYIDAGGLMSYGPNFADLFRRSAEIVDKVLRGTKPADIPVEQPTKFELVINLKTAKTLGLDVPSMLLARADEVIE